MLFLKLNQMNAFGGEKPFHKTENMPKKLKKIPVFKNETEEREFWEKENSTDYIDWDSAEIKTLPKLKPTTRTISLSNFRGNARKNPSRR